MEINSSEYKILIVDDVMSNVLLLKVLLTNEKFAIATASNGTQALAQVEKEHPDLVLLDVMMPDMSGFEVAQKLKSNPATKDIPIIFLTALNSTADIVKGFQVGANDFISKPFNKEELITRVYHQISLVAANRTILQQNEELQHTVEGRDQLYSVISHDLRSPIGSIKMVLNMLILNLPAEKIGSDMYELLTTANQTTEDVFALLDNLLKWTKSQTGRLKVAFQEFEISDVITGVADIFSLIAETKKIKLTTEYLEEGLKVRADKDMLNTVLRNFLSNAIKFSNEDSSIEIVVSRKDNFAKVGIRDHGVGIAPDRIDTIFHKGETTYGTNNEEGSGLGLQLCKDFAVKNGGDVMVESVVGEGSTFSVLVPLVASQN